MNVVRSIDEIRACLQPDRAAGRTIAFVPTMGALHEGHLSLVQAARDLADVVVLSIFVNPTQFSPGEDFDRYPRAERRDLELAGEAKVDLAFIPEVGEMYPPGADTTVAAGRLGTIVEGSARPGHFDGVATIVVKLLNIVQPRWVLFGQKDAQQVAVIKQVVADLALPVEVVVCPTYRDPDGLALSSRNVYLEDPQRRSALAVIGALRAGEQILRATQDVEATEKVMKETLTAAGLEIDYASVVDPETFMEPMPQGDRLLVVAARVGATRLIDNLLVKSLRP